METTKLSLVINTCALDPLVTMPMYGVRSYRARAELLHDQILPLVRTQAWDEVFVVGQFEAGDGYEYVPMEPIYRDRRDALWQRELGARVSTGDVIAFSHDDHCWAGRVETLRTLARDVLVVPRRIDNHGNELNNGRQAGYMGGHCLAMHRRLWARVPWTTVDTVWWDTTLTRIWREEGARIEWTDELTHIDLDT